MLSKESIVNFKIFLLAAVLLAPRPVLAAFTTCSCNNLPPPSTPSTPTASDASVDESKKIISSSSDLQVAPKPPEQTKSGSLIEFVAPVFVYKSKSCY